MPLCMLEASSLSCLFRPHMACLAAADCHQAQRCHVPIMQTYAATKPPHLLNDRRPRLVINQTSTPAIIAGPLAASRCRFPSRPRSSAHRRTHEIHGRFERQKCISLSGISKLLKSASGIQTDCARDMAATVFPRRKSISTESPALMCPLTGCTSRLFRAPGNIKNGLPTGETLKASAVW